MKHLDYLYFNIYNHFYKASQSRQGVNPRLQAMYLFALGSGGWLLLLEALYLHLVKHSRFSSHAGSTIFSASLYMLLAYLFNQIFIVQDRDLRIFSKYEESSNRNPKRKGHLILSFGILILPYLALVSCAVFFSTHKR